MINKKTKYGIKALISLAGEYASHCPVLISELAVRERIHKKFLELILLELKKAGILFSKKGKGGGYLLAKNPEKISLAEIIRTLEWSLAPIPCLSQRTYRKCEECTDEATCGIRKVMSAWMLGPGTNASESTCPPRSASSAWSRSGK